MWGWKQALTLITVEGAALAEYLTRQNPFWCLLHLRLPSNAWLLSNACHKLLKLLRLQNWGLFQNGHICTVSMWEKVATPGYLQGNLQPTGRQLVLDEVGRWQPQQAGGQDPQDWQKKKSHIKGMCKKDWRHWVLFGGKSVLRGEFQKKRYFWGIFPKWRTTPPFWEPLSWNFLGFILHFRP